MSVEKIRVKAIDVSIFMNREYYWHSYSILKFDNTLFLYTIEIFIDINCLLIIFYSHCTGWKFRKILIIMKINAKINNNIISRFINLILETTSNIIII